ncbi:acetyl-CoA carboxylase carboxyl transferase subunit alpha/beta [Streptomyces sp. NBC_00124]|uniref:carboxyl transferase domain-containing protein n=1 Tax=Streptomyces sp. NBC_00124 TaxID=2975662 RepID=UPI002251E772|nr:carboxyl transferase domain-containing protein [Streptomyces sp. NBC_00124]MCX5363854.1 acetyl-CoA carboxylase carboxyl transferase subunit alpha/beta [Streptomyces sp. NBC_00124]
MTDRLSAREFLALVTEDFTELPYPARESEPDGPLAWQGYDAARARAAERTGEDESVVCGTGKVEGIRAVLLAFEFGYLGGSLGVRTGDRLEAAYTYARAHRLPVVPLVATGGSRMQEGMLALTQLQRVARQSALTREAGLPQIAVLRDPTTGGGWATLGAGADIILALPGAQIGFAGSRVRPPDADPRAYTAEAQVAAGAVDAVVRPEELRKTLGRWLRLLTGSSTRAAPVPRTPTPGHSVADDTAGPPTAGVAPEALGSGGTAARPTSLLAAGKTDPAPTDGTPQAPDPPRVGTRMPPPADGTQDTLDAPPADDSEGPSTPSLPHSGWEAVQRARSPRRPRAASYLDTYFAHRVAISGDRCGGTDPGMLCGFGEHAGRTVAYAAQAGTPTRPAGYRTAARLIRLADRLGIPVLTLVDTPGAANDAEAERQGAGASIAEVFGAVASARTPITTLLIGEGGSGGALALAAPGNTWATPDSYFSVIAPESAAAILKRPPEETAATADQLRIRPQDLVELGVVRDRTTPSP